MKRLRKGMTDRETILKLIRVKRAADGRIPMPSCQGQAMDGYSELANYRAIIGVIEVELILEGEDIDEPSASDY
jgi:hypothetical protein